MEFTYETVGTATFLTCTAQADEFDPFSLKMLEHNTVDGLLPFSSILENRVRKIRYTVTSCETLESYISRPLPLANILNILESIAAAAGELEEYMLYPGGIVAEPSHMYTEIGTGKTRLVYLPVKECGQTDLFSFLRGLPGSVQYADPESAVCVLKISNEINSGKITGISGFLEAVREAKRDLSGTGKQKTGAPEPERSPQRERGQREEPQESGPKAAQRPAPVWKNGEGGLPAPEKGPAVSFSVPVLNQQTAKKEQEKGEASGFHLFGGKKKPEKEEKKEDGKKKKQKEEKKPEKRMASPGFAIPGMDQAPAVAIEQEPKEPAKEKKGFLNFKRKEKGKTPENAADAQIPAGFLPQDAVRSKEAYRMDPIQPQEAGLDFGSTILAQPDDELTMVDGYAEAPEAGIACLLRRANGQRMYLEQEITRIGRESAYVDFYIGDNLRIGRSHAEIIRKGDTYYIRDNHSKNHTYVNGQMVTGEEMVPLKVGDVIMLANEAFEYRED